MPVGSGLSASFGIATETTPLVPVAVTRFAEFDSETMALKKGVVQGAGLRGGGLDRRAQRRMLVTRMATGGVNFDAMTNGFGLFLQHMLGSFTTTPASIGGGLFRQVHNTGPLAGKTFTTQIVKPDTTGVLAPQAFTYPGCKVTDWELSVAVAGQVKVKLTIDAIDEATPTNGFASTTTTAVSVAAASSLTTTASIPAGTYIVVDTGLLAEVVQTGVPSGAGPFTIPIVTTGGLAQGHASGVYVGSATNVNYGAATALQTASYNAATNMFAFQQGKLVAGGTTSVVSGVWTNTGGQTVANVRTVSVKGKTPVASRPQLGSMLRNEQLDNGWRDYTGSVDVEYNGRAFYDAYAADLALCIQLTFTNPAGAVLQVFAPAAFLEDGASPNVAGPDIIIQKLNFTFLNDGVNGALQVVYTSTDVAC